MNFSITEFRSQITKEGELSGGTRYACRISFPANLAGTSGDFLIQDLAGNKHHPMLCKAVRLPAAEVPPVVLSYMARKVKIPGTRIYQPVTLSFFNTNNYRIRRAFEEWQGLFSSYRSNARGERDRLDPVEGFAAPVARAFATVELTARDMKGRAANVYRFERAFPTRIGGLEYGYDNQDVQMYNVDFEYLTAIQTTNVGVEKLSNDSEININYGV